MLSAFTNSLKIPELRQRIFYTLSLLFVARVAAVVPLPGLDPAPLKAFFADQTAAFGPPKTLKPDPGAKLARAAKRTPKKANKNEDARYQ